MMGRPVYFPGDLVFAKVKGYPPWPARVTAGPSNNGRFAIFFYGTFEKAFLKSIDIFPFNTENKDKFATPTNVKRKGYTEGLYQIENTPDIVDLADIDHSQPVKKLAAKVDDRASVPQSRTKGQKRSQSHSDIDGAEDEAVKTPDICSPSTVSRAGRVSRPCHKLNDSRNTGSESVGKAAEKIIEDPRKVWVKLKASGDLVEINLNRDKPDQWENNTQKIQWELGTARNALKFREMVQSGKFIPAEVLKKVEGQTDLTEEETEIYRKAAELDKRRRKITWLKTEATLVGLDHSIKMALSSTNPQINKVCDLLSEVLLIDLQRLMLLKQPDIVTTVRKLRKYVGPLDQSGYTESDKNSIKNGVSMIVARSQACITKFTLLFSNSRNLPDFHELFEDEVAKFRAKVHGWEENKVLSLTEELK